MPTPFHCHNCDSPTMNKNGTCEKCINKNITYLDNRIEWLTKGLKLIATANEQHNPIHLIEVAQSYLDGEPTTADENNTIPNYKKQ